MDIHWIPLIVGLCLGLIPPRLLIKGECRFLMFEELWAKLRPEPWETRRRRWWKLPLVWIDPLRGFTVGMYLMQAFSRPKDGSGLTTYYVMGATALALLGCLKMQATVRRYSEETISPMSFLAGMLVAVLPYTVSIPTIVVAGATIIAVRDYIYGYFAAMLCCVGFGILFMGRDLFLLTPMAMILLPVWVTWQSGTRMVVPVRC